LTFLTTLIFLSLIVFIHELGHFIAARACGVQVQTFSVGFGPAIFSFKDKKNTKWQLSAIPLGGYIQMPLDKLFGFKRIVVSFAGPLMNFVFALGLFFTVIFVNGSAVIQPLVKDITPNSLAEKNDIRAGDEVVSINGKPIEHIHSVLNSSKDVELNIKRGEDTLVKRIKMTEDKLGISFATALKKLSALDSLKKSAHTIWLICSNMLYGLFSWGNVKNMGSVISVFSLSKEHYEAGVYVFLNFIAFLSINLGFLNLLPIPVLDGGYILLGFYELITGRRVNEKLYNRIMTIGFLLILFVMIGAILNDIFRG